MCRGWLSDEDYMRYKWAPSLESSDGTHEVGKVSSGFAADGDTTPNRMEACSIDMHIRRASENVRSFI